VAADQQPVEVAWPTTLALEDEGFVDTYRAVHPDPVERPAYTWTPTTKPTNPNDHHDRDRLRPRSRRGSRRRKRRDRR
jgi:exodeoxyribonuclease III